MYTRARGANVRRSRAKVLFFFYLFFFSMYWCIRYVYICTHVYTYTYIYANAYVHSQLHLRIYAHVPPVFPPSHRVSTQRTVLLSQRLALGLSICTAFESPLFVCIISRYDLYTTRPTYPRFVNFYIHAPPRIHWNAGLKESRNTSPLFSFPPYFVFFYVFSRASGVMENWIFRTVRRGRDWRRGNLCAPSAIKRGVRISF